MYYNLFYYNSFHSYLIIGNRQTWKECSIYTFRTCLPGVYCMNLLQRKDNTRKSHYMAICILFHDPITMATSQFYDLPGLSKKYTEFYEESYTCSTYYLKI